MDHRTVRIAAALFGAALLIRPAYSNPTAGKAPAPGNPEQQQSAPKDEFQSIVALLRSDEERAEQLAERTLSQLELRKLRAYKPEKADQDRRKQDKKVLVKHIRADAETWAQYTIIASARTRSADEDKLVDDFLATINTELGDATTKMNAEDLTTAVRDRVQRLFKGIDANKRVLDAGGLAAFIENNIRPHGQETAAPPGAQPGRKPTVVRLNESIRTFNPGDPYIHRHETFQYKVPNGQELHMQLYGNYADQDGMYAIIAETSESRDMRAMAIPLSPNSVTPFKFKGQTYVAEVRNTHVKGFGDDLVVRIYLAGKDGQILSVTREDKDSGEKKRVPAELFPEDRKVANVHAPGGLVEHAIRKAVNGYDNKDGSADRFIQYLGEGASKRKYYVVPQAGPDGGLAYYEAPAGDESMSSAEIVAKLMENESTRRIAYAFQISKPADAGGAQVALGPDKATAIAYGGAFYQYRWNDKAPVPFMELTRHATNPTTPTSPTQPQPPAQPGTGPRPPTPPPTARVPQDRGTDYPEVDPAWPKQLKGPMENRRYTAHQHAINEVLKGMNVDYRIYRSTANFPAKVDAQGEAVLVNGHPVPDESRPLGHTFFAVKAAVKDTVIPSDKMNGSQLAANPAPDAQVSVQGAYLVIQSPSKGYLFDVNAPKTMADLPEGGDREVLRYVQFFDLDAKRDGDLTLKVETLDALGVALSRLGFEEGRATAVLAKAAQAAEGKKIQAIQGTKKGKDSVIRVFVEGGPDAGHVVHGDGAAQEPAKPATPAGSQSKGKDAAPAPAPGELMFDFSETPIEVAKGGLNEKSIPHTIDGKAATIYQDAPPHPEFKYALYCNKTPCPQDKKEKGVVWFVRWEVLKDGKPTGWTTAPLRFDYRDGMAVRSLNVKKDADAKNLVLRTDPLPGHEKAYAAFLMPYEANAVRPMFHSHLLHIGPEPSAADHK